MDELDNRIHASDYAEVREKFAPWAPDTGDSWTQDSVVRLLEPTGAREDGSLTGTHYFASLFFPESIKKLMTPERIKYLKMLDDDTIPNLYALTHRGFAKTTLGIMFCTRSLSCRQQKYILYTSSIYKVAAKRTEAIRAAITSPQLKEIFGNMEPMRGSQVGASFSEEAFMLVDPDTNRSFAFVEPKGSEQVVNGSLVMLGNEMVRPTLILSDDGQKRQHIQNEEVRERYVDWWISEVEPTVEADAEPDPKTHRWIKPANNGLWRPPFRRIVTDTCKHVNAHIVQLETNPDWFGCNFPLCEEVDGEFKIRHRIITQKELNARIRRFKMQGKMDEFYREYMCKPSASENRAWHTEMHQHYNDRGEKLDGAFKFIVVDPARSIGKSAAFTSILGVAVVPERGIFFRRNVVARMAPDDYYKATFDMARELKTRLILVEETGLALVVKNAFHQAASMAGLAGQVEFDWLQSKRSPGVEYGTGPDAIKVARAAAVFPFYKQGLVFHDESLRNGPLERAQIQFPDCTFWDATDTAGYVPEIMERYEVFLDCKGDGKRIVIDNEYDDAYEHAGEFFRSREWCS